MLCNCCHRHVHRNCTALSCYEFTIIKNSALWFCRICNGNIFPFNNIDDENEFQLTIQDFGRCSLNTTYQSLYVDSKIFDPFDINENDDNIIEYQGELDPDKNYSNQLAHHLSRSSNYYSEDTLNKLICQKRYTFRSFFICYMLISEVSLSMYQVLCLTWIISTYAFQWLVFLKHGCLHSQLTQMEWMDTIMLVWLERLVRVVVCLYILLKNLHTLNFQNLV